MMIAMTVGACILLGAGLEMGSRIIHSMGLREAADRTTVRTPIGDFRFEKAKQVGPGLPVYPQAMLVLPGDATRAPQDDAEPQVVASTYHTNSSREYVEHWYLEHLDSEFVRQDRGPKNLPEPLRGAHISDDDIMFIGERGDQVRAVSLTEDNTGTKITLLRSAKAPSQAPAPPADAPAQPSQPPAPSAQ